MRSDPTATWTDVYDALVPNGVMLTAYANGFYASGFGATGWAVSGGEPTTENNYSQNLHRWMAEVNSGVGVEDAKAGMAQGSVASRYDRVKIPVFIVQGLNDGLFSANQAIDAYQAVKSRTVRPRLYLGGIGHPPSDGSLDSREATYVGNQVLAWFDFHLKGIDNGIDELPPIEFSRADYFHNRWDGTTRTAKRYPFGDAERLHLCTTGPTGGTLSATACPDALPAVATNANAGTGWDQEPVTAGYAEDLEEGFGQYLGGEMPNLTTAPTILDYETPALAAAFAEPLAAVAPGTSTVPAHPVEFDAFGLSNVIPAGHRLRIAFQTSDAPYLRPTPNPFAVAVLPGSAVELPGLGGGKGGVGKPKKARRCARVTRSCTRFHR